MFIPTLLHQDSQISITKTLLDHKICQVWQKHARPRLSIIRVDNSQTRSNFLLITCPCPSDMKVSSSNAYGYSVFLHSFSSLSLSLSLSLSHSFSVFVDEYLFKQLYVKLSLLFMYGIRFFLSCCLFTQRKFVCPTPGYIPLLVPRKGKKVIARILTKSGQPPSFHTLHGGRNA